MFDPCLLLDMQVCLNIEKGSTDAFWAVLQPAQELELLQLTFDGIGTDAEVRLCAEQQRELSSFSSQTVTLHE